MNDASRLTLRWSTAIAVVLALLAVGGATVYLAVRSQLQRPTTTTGPASGTASMTAPAAGQMPSAESPVSQGQSADVIVTLTPEATQRAGIVLSTVSTAAAESTLRLPGVIEANAYKQVVVTPLVAGRVTRVLAQLGQTVRRGQPLAEIFSPELAEAETRYVSIRAELEAHERELQRTEKLVEIGAASRQELERLHAEHAAKLTAVESARSRLQLLGLPPSTIASLGPGKDVGAETMVPAPIDGVVTERTANAGLNVDPSARLFTVVDLSNVWVVADAYEKDFSRIRTAAWATVSTKAYPNLAIRGRVSYIDPQVNPETRTAKVRVEIPNPGAQLRLGMFADVSIENRAASPGVRIPREAAQNVGDRTVVYVADQKQPGRFIEREVRLGEADSDGVMVLSGLNPGDRIVSHGSFSVRAERDRLGLGPTGTQDVKVLVTEQGFEPARLTVRAGSPVRITFTRTTDKTCATEVALPSLSIKRALPLSKPVTIEFTPSASSDIAFVCGMNMLRGAVVVQP